jgi:CheY-like chemotaxis protein
MFTDEGKVAQILRNLISNALKFTEAGEVHVSANHDSRAQVITFAVSDSGIGIEEADQVRIFEEFSQVEGPLQKAAKGTGLGLPLSRKLAELLGGELWCESEPGKGSTFYLSMPIRLPGDGAELPRGDRKRILVIDDDETFRYVLQQILTEGNAYEFLEAHDGVTGLDAIRTQQPDLVLLDLQMPEKDGFEVLHELSADPELATRPVIVCTSLHLDLEALARLPGNVPILAKRAVSRERVRAMIDNALSALKRPPS